MELQLHLPHLECLVLEFFADGIGSGAAVASSSMRVLSFGCKRIGSGVAVGSSSM